MTGACDHLDDRRRAYRGIFLTRLGWVHENLVDEVPEIMGHLETLTENVHAHLAAQELTEEQASELAFEFGSNEVMISDHDVCELIDLYEDDLAAARELLVGGEELVRQAQGLMADVLSATKRAVTDGYADEEDVEGLEETMSRLRQLCDRFDKADDGRRKAAGRIDRTPSFGIGMCHRCLAVGSYDENCISCQQFTTHDVLGTSIGPDLERDANGVLQIAPARVQRQLAERLAQCVPVERSSYSHHLSIPLNARWGPIASAVSVAPVQMVRSVPGSIKIALTPVGLIWSDDMKEYDAELLAYVDPSKAFFEPSFSWPQCSFIVFGARSRVDSRSPVQQLADHLAAVVFHLNNFADPLRFKPVDWSQVEQPWGLH